ncbi:SRPBCC family protein [Bacteriovoracaceae bacterium]|nr:SRPBCC family protein [Bacteriovoracaceae bacterium]
MEASANKFIMSTKEKVWDVVTDLEQAKDRIESIKEIEVLNKSDSGFVGTKWKETRDMFGKEAVETMWIIEAKEYEYYISEARNTGTLYHSTIRLEEESKGVRLHMSFTAKPESLFAKLLSPLMFFMKGMIRKAFIKDLEDIKKYLENSK